MDPVSGREKQFKRTVLIDRPADSDAFSGGGHARTAKALATTIKQFDKADRAIGLEGSWGSGKSTVVNLAEGELNAVSNCANYRVFTFDLWANQTTNFRRAFLESLLDWGESSFPQSDKFIENYRRIVGDRTKTVRTNNIRDFSWFGMVAIVFLIALPVFYTWFSPFAFNNLDGRSIFSDEISGPNFPIGTVISLVGLAAIMIIIVAKAYVERPSKSTWDENWRLGFSRAFSVFSKESEKTSITQNIRDEDPTQYEFNKIFREIVAKFQSGGNHLVIVFDNIDRLPIARIADVWSEVRSVFHTVQNNEGEKNGVEQSITAIVPYDRMVALQALSHKDIANGDGYLESDMFRKSFDAILNVAPPVLTDAAKFFVDQFQIASGEHFDVETAKRVYRIFDLHVKKTHRPTTPRQTIAFINRLTGWYEQWRIKLRRKPLQYLLLINLILR